jgi:hypothetical protein
MDTKKAITKEEIAVIESVFERIGVKPLITLGGLPAYEEMCGWSFAGYFKQLSEVICTLNKLDGEKYKDFIKCLDRVSGVLYEITSCNGLFSDINILLDELCKAQMPK